METPLVSVLMPVHNGARFVRGAVESILGQTHGDLEFIIIDDGSTDQTPEILDGYADPRIVRLRTPLCRGVVWALNRGVEAARGEYIARQDADDLSAPRRLERQVAFLTAHPDVGLLGSAFTVIGPSGQIARVASPPTRNGVIQQRLLGANCFCHGAVMFRRACVRAVGTYRPEMFPAEDYDLWLRISERFQVANLPEILYWYREWNESVSGQHGRRQMERIVAAVEAAVIRRTGPAAPASSSRGLIRGLLFVGLGRWALGDRMGGVDWLRRAYAMDGRAVRGAFPQAVVDRAWSALTAGDSIEALSRFVDAAFTDLPVELHALRRHRNRAKANWYALLAHRAYARGEWIRTRRWAMTAMRTHPAWLLRRAMYAVLIRSIVEGQASA